MNFSVIHNAQNALQILSYRISQIWSDDKLSIKFMQHLIISYSNVNRLHMSKCAMFKMPVQNILRQLQHRFLLCYTILWLHCQWPTDQDCSSNSSLTLWHSFFTSWIWFLQKQSFRIPTPHNQCSLDVYCFTATQRIEFSLALLVSATLTVSQHAMLNVPEGKVLKIFAHLYLSAACRGNIIHQSFLLDWWSRLVFPNSNTPTNTMTHWKHKTSAKKTTSSDVLVNSNWNIETVVLCITWHHDVAIGEDLFTDEPDKVHHNHHNDRVASSTLAAVDKLETTFTVHVRRLCLRRQFTCWASLQACQMQILVNKSVDQQQWNSILLDEKSAVDAVHFRFIFLTTNMIMYIAYDIKNASSPRQSTARPMWWWRQSYIKV